MGSHSDSKKGVSGDEIHPGKSVAKEAEPVDAYDRDGQGIYKNEEHGNVENYLHYTYGIFQEAGTEALELEQKYFGTTIPFPLLIALGAGAIYYFSR